MIGKKVSHYKITEELGHGGMGVVYKAIDLKLERLVALKFLPHHLGQDEESKKRFINEAKAASALEHNNICTIHEIDETEDGQLFIVMSFYTGESLKNKIKRGPLNLTEAIDITIQIARGLEKAHQHKIIHRDIKPANIMITDESVVKIVDFGLAKLTGHTQITREDTTLGTIAYMSPQQARGEGVDHRSDIWSTGVVLYEMITGEKPFRGDYDQAVIYSILNEDPEPITDIRKGIPPEIEQLVQKSLAKNPDERFQQMHDLLDELAKIKGEQATVIKKPETKKGKYRFRDLKISPILWIPIIAIVGLIAFIILFYPSSAISFSERDWILITDLKNETEEPVFNKSLNTALHVSIAQSEYINVLPQNRIQETLRRMKKPDEIFVDESIGREISLREGIKVLVVPSIGQIGNEYILAAIIEDSQKGEALFSEMVRAKGKDQILSSLDNLSQKIRQDLGESIDRISRQSKPLSEVTTSSLEALKQYTLGIENQWKGNFPEARTCYENALKIDTGFTSAKASLGMLIFEKFYRDRELGKKLLSRAVKSVNLLTEKEKYGILAFHANAVENDLNKAIDYTKILTGLYPDYYPAHNNLGWYYSQIGYYREAVTEYKKALQLNPYVVFTYSGLNWLYLNQLAELDSAFVWINRQIAYNEDNPWGYDYLGWAYLGIDSLHQAQRAFEKALSFNPNFILDLYRLAHTYRLQGSYRDAIPLLNKIIELNPTEESAYYDLGVNYQLMGDDQSARSYFKKYQKFAEGWIQDNPHYGNYYILLGIALSRLGQWELGMEMGKKGLSLDSTLHFEYAQLLCIQNRKQEALKHLELAVKNGYRMFIWMKIHPDLHAVYDEPRFQELIQQIRYGE